MAVEKLASGRIFVGAPYKRTAAENYVSMFTKSRAEEFERAQKDARDEQALKTLEYKAQLAAYQERIKANERLRAKLQDLLVRTQNKEIDDQTARQELAYTLGEKYAARQDAMARASAATGTYTTGGTTTTSGGGGGGRRAPSPDAVSDAAEEQLLLSKEAADPLENPVGYVSDVRGKIGTGYIPAQTPEEADAVRYRATNEAIDADAAARIRQNPSMTYEEAYTLAEGSVLSELDNSGAADFSQSYSRVKDKQDAEAAAAGTPRTSVSTRKVGFYKKNPNLPPPADVKPLLLPEVPSRAGVQEDIRAAIGAIPEAGAVPLAPSMDPFTRGRTLYAERFGPSVPMQPFQARRTLDILKGLPPELQAQVGEAYRKYLLEQEARTAPTTPTTPTAAPVVPAAAPPAGAPEAAPAPAVPPAPVPPPAAEAPVDPNFFREYIPGPTVSAGQSAMAETFPYEEAIRAAESGVQRPPAPPPPPPEPEDPEVKAARLRAQAAVRARELAARRAEMEALSGKRAADRALVEGMLSPLNRMSTEMPAVPPMTAPGGRTVEDLSFADRPRFAPQQAAPVPPVRINTDRAAELALLGVKPEGELMATPAPTGPSAALAAPKTPAAAPPGYLKAKGPLATKSPADIERETDEKILRIAEVMQIQKQLVADPKFLERTLKTKAGDTAARVYRANAASKKGLNATQNALVDEFMGNTDDMKVALAVAYALDSLSKPKSPADALTPKE